MVMAFQCFYKRGPQLNNSKVEDGSAHLKISSFVDVPLDMNCDQIVCPVCLESPHNCVLLQCSSYEKGCRAYVCDTGHLHSNCLDRFKNAYGMTPSSKSPPSPDSDTVENLQLPESGIKEKPACPLCRGEVNGWVIIENTRQHLDQKKRCCEEAQCKFSGTFLELQKHAQVEHPDSRPSKIDPARQLDWENFQQSSEIIDVLSTIHSEVPRGVVLGDYVIEYGDDDTTDEFEDFPGDDGNWWTSCILYQVFENFRNSRNRRRTRRNALRRGSRRSSYDNSNSDEGSVTSIEFPEYRGEDTDDEYVNPRGPSRNSSVTSVQQSSRRRRSRFYDN